MAPPLLALRDIHLTFGSTPLLTGADIAVHERERLCLVGRNGSGKSTLLKIAAGQVEQDEGERFFQPGTTVRYLPQEPDFSDFATVRDYVEDGLVEADDPYRAQLCMEALGLTGDEPTGNLSGGEARRAALARVLAPEPDILLLDEPTNHLDLPAIAWLEEELARLRSAIVLISHDRRFLENLSRKTLWVDRGVTRLLDKSFAAFEDWRDETLAQEELDAHKLDRKIVREEHWVTHGVSGRRKRNMKRLGDLGDLRQQRAERLKPQGTATVSVVAAETSGKLVAKVEQVSKAYGDRVLVDDFSSRIARGDRIGIVGPNGAGKTTLLNIITGQAEPDSGTVKLGANIEMLVVDQKRMVLDPNTSVRDTLTGGGTDVVEIGDRTKHVLAYMKDFLFLPEQAGTPTHALSGGERGRLMLAMRLRHPSNLLVLDEPTNDLDLETLDLLQETIADYEGTVLLVSHDRDFLDRICTSVIVAEGDGVWREYAGGWTDMLSQRGAAPFAAVDEPAAKAVTQPPHRTSRKRPPLNSRSRNNTPSTHCPPRWRSTRRISPRSTPPWPRRGPTRKTRARFDKMVRLLGQTQAKLDAAEERWLELEEKREALEA